MDVVKEMQSPFEKASSLIQSLGWEEGFERLLVELPFKESRDIRLELSPQYAGWIGLLNPHHCEAAFVIDLGWGSFPIAMSKFYKKVYLVSGEKAVRVCQEARIKSLGITNITYLEESLPFAVPDQTIDTVMLHFLPESLCLQKVFLQEVKRVLHQEGICLIHFENRYDYIKFQMKPFEKRNSANDNRLSPYTVMRRLKPYFNAIDLYPCTKSRYQLLSILMPKCAGTLWEDSVLSAKKRIKQKLQYHIGSTFGVIASNKAEAPSCVSMIMAEVSDLLNKKKPFTLRRLLVGKPLSLLLFVGESACPEEFVIKIPLDELTLQKHKSQFLALTDLSHEPSTEGKTPEPILSGRCGNFAFFVERRITGETPYDCSESMTLQAVTFLTKLHCATSTPVVFQENEFKEHINLPFSRAARWINNPVELDHLQQGVVTSLACQRIPLVRSHGDFTFDNLMANPSSGALTGIIDWDYSMRSSLPLIDLLYFLDYDAMWHQGKSLAEITQQRFSPDAYTSFEREIINTYCDRLQISLSLLPAFTVLSWVYCITHRFEALGSYRFPDVIHWGIPPVLNTIKRMTTPVPKSAFQLPRKGYE